MFCLGARHKKAVKEPVKSQDNLQNPLCTFRRQNSLFESENQKDEDSPESIDIYSLSISECSEISSFSSFRSNDVSERGR